MRKMLVLAFAALLIAPAFAITNVANVKLVVDPAKTVWVDGDIDLGTIINASGTKTSSTLVHGGTNNATGAVVSVAATGALFASPTGILVTWGVGSSGTTMAVAGGSSDTSDSLWVKAVVADYSAIAGTYTGTLTATITDNP